MTLNDKKNKLKEIITIEMVLDYYASSKISSSGMCLCPIHTETQPSCKINKNTNMFRCFACGAGGDIIALVQEKFKLPYNKAIEKLSKDFNVMFEDLSMNEEECRSRVLQAKKEQVKKTKAQLRKEFVLQKNNEICKILLTLRKKCVTLHKEPILSESEMDLHTVSKARIRKLEDIYLTLNGLGQEDLQITQNELIDKLKMGVIEL